MKRTPATILTLLIAVSLLAVPALADGGVPSTVPHTFYGQVYDIDGSKAPAGSIVVAAVAGAPAGTITVAPAGQYGKDYTDGDADKLGVWHSAIQSGDTIAFYLDGVRATETAIYESGGLTNLTLTASAPLPKERPKESTTRPVDATGGEPVTVDGGNASVVLTTKGDFQGETLVFTLFTAPPDDQSIPPGNKDIGRFAEITSTITNDNIQTVRVTLHYTGADVAGIDEASIRVYWWSANNSTWVQLPGGVDAAANFAWGETDHFSTFGLFGVTVKPSPTGKGGGGGGGGGDVFIEPTANVTPAMTGEETPTPAGATETSAATAAMTGAPGATAGAEVTQDGPGAAAAGDLPTVAIVAAAGIVVVAAAGFLLLRRR